MKKLYLLLLCILCTAISKGEVNEKTYNFSFNVTDFSITTDDKGITHVENMTEPTYFGEPNKPAIPVIKNHIQLDLLRKCVDISYETSKTVIARQVTLATAPEFSSPVDSASSVAGMCPTSTNATDEYSFFDYSQSGWKDINLLNFAFSPFIYNANTGDLYFVHDLTVTVRTSELNEEEIAKLGNAPLGIHELYGIAATEDVNLSDKGMARAAGNNPANQFKNKPASDVDYLIVTTQALKSSFSPLISWKKKKGLRAEIITLEEINAIYQDPLPQLRIKKYIYNLYLNNNLKYVLLGGDHETVPSLITKVKANSNAIEDVLASDAYYACFGGNFEWDLNNNQIYGEYDDSIDFTPSVYVARALVGKPQDVNIFVNKTLDFEKSPRWNNCLLASGTKWNTDADARSQFNVLYEDCFEGWNGTRYDFFDTGITVPGAENFQVNGDNLQTVLENGYSLIEMSTHGWVDAWILEDEKNYTSANALTQFSPVHSIILTSSCETNSFDRNKDTKNGLCLSNGFFNNYNNGVVGFWGSSRSGFYPFRNERYGLSQKFEVDFFKELLSDKHQFNSFGMLTTLAKYKNIGTSKSSLYNYLQRGLNTIGDPEMQIYSEIPEQIEACYTSHGLSANIDGCTVSITSTDDDGDTRMSVCENFSLSQEITIPTNSTVCLTKKNCIPYIFEVSYNGSLPKGGINTILSCTYNSMSGISTVVTNVESKFTTAELVLSDINGNIKDRKRINTGQQTTTFDNKRMLFSTLYVMSLFIDGKLRDAIKY